MTRDYNQLYIGGTWATPASQETLSVHSPNDGHLVGTVPVATQTDIDRAVAAAQGALADPAWRNLDAAQRAELLERFAEALELNIEDRAALTSLQNGMPISLARISEGPAPSGLLRYYAAVARSIPIEEQRPRLDGASITLVRREPVGVVAAVVPWNFPQVLTMSKVAPALAAGCSVVLKPSPETVLDAFALAEAAEKAGLPAGVINVVPGGRDIGAYLVAHPGVDKVAFTGSTAAGRQIGEVCGRLLRPVTLELGGKSAAIVLDDADLATIAGGIATASLLNNGQTCYLSTRILVPRGRHDEVLDAIVGVAESLVVGDPLDAGTQIGPLVSERQRDLVESYIAGGKGSGATLATGGSRPAGLDQGWFVAPTVFGGVSNDQPIAREEIFGPVLSVVPYDGIEQAVAIANDSPFGLGGTVWTRDTERGIDIARRMQTGTVGINYYDLDVNAPFGGVKASGLGREFGPEGLAAYLNYKSVYLPA